MKDYYRILDIQFNAHSEDIKRAYRKLALKYHPDQNHNASAEEKFIEIREAYEMLRDEQKRKLYNAMYMAHFMNKARNLNTYQQRPYTHATPPHSPFTTSYKSSTSQQPKGNGAYQHTQTSPPPPPKEENGYQYQAPPPPRSIPVSNFKWELHGKYVGILFAMVAVVFIGWVAISYTAKSTRGIYFEQNGWDFTAVIIRNIVILVIGVILQYKGISQFIQHLLQYREALKT